MKSIPAVSLGVALEPFGDGVKALQDLLEQGDYRFAVVGGIDTTRAADSLCSVSPGSVGRPAAIAVRRRPA